MRLSVVCLPFVRLFGVQCACMLLFNVLHWCVVSTVLRFLSFLAHFFVRNMCADVHFQMFVFVLVSFGMELSLLFWFSCCFGRFVFVWHGIASVVLVFVWHWVVAFGEGEEQ